DLQPLVFVVDTAVVGGNRHLLGRPHGRRRAGSRRRRHRAAGRECHGLVERHAGAEKNYCADSLLHPHAFTPHIRTQPVFRVISISMVTLTVSPTTAPPPSRTRL